MYGKRDNSWAIYQIITDKYRIYEISNFIRYLAVPVILLLSTRVEAEQWIQNC